MIGCDFGSEVGYHWWRLATDPRHVLAIGRMSDRDYSRNIVFCGFTDHAVRRSRQIQTSLTAFVTCEAFRSFATITRLQPAFRSCSKSGAIADTAAPTLGANRGQCYQTIKGIDEVTG